METLPQARRESHAGYDKRDLFFYHERLCQYEPYTEQHGSYSLSIDNCRRYITASIWPRLVVIRVKHVLSALLPLLNLAEDGTCSIILNGASSILSPLGWVLHGIRLLINTHQLLQKAVTNDQVKNAEKLPELYSPAGTHLQNHGVSMGNDLIWVLSSIAPNTIHFTCAFFVIDILWLSGRAWVEMARINQSFDSIDPTDDCILVDKLTKEWIWAQHKFLLNLTNLVSISAISIIKNFVLPTAFPALALNPLCLLTLSLLSLAITIVTHLIGQELERQKQCDARHPIHRSVAVSASQIGFFGDLCTQKPIKKVCEQRYLQPSLRL